MNDIFNNQPDQISTKREKELSLTNYSFTTESSFPFKEFNIINLINLMNGIEDFSHIDDDDDKLIISEGKGKRDENKRKQASNNKKYFIIGEKKKRGREIKGNKNKLKCHDKNSSDNLLRKIQVHYISFIISFINEILENLGCNQKFFKLDYKFKFNIKKEFVESLKTKNIGEIICNEISSKYKEDSNYNKKIYDQIKENEVLKKIFSENYLVIFRKFYYQNKDKINLSEYGLDIEIKLSKKVEMFNDLYNKINSKNQYTKNIKDFVLQKYFSPPKFEVIKEASNKHL
jgi:hypothetical protein